MIDESFITSYITSTFENVETAVNLGYTFFFYRDDHMHAFATIASSGNEYERISNLDRLGSLSSEYRREQGNIPSVVWKEQDRSKRLRLHRIGYDYAPP